MTIPKIELIESLPYAKTGLSGFGGAAMLVSLQGDVQSVNDPGAELLNELSDDAVREIAHAAAQTRRADAARLERLNGPFPGECADAIFLPLVGDAGVLVLIATNPAESAVRRALIESRQRYRDLIEASSDFVWETDRHGRFIFISPRGAMGYSSRDLLGRVATDFIVDASALADPVFQVREPALAVDVWLQRADGHISCQSMTAVPIFDEAGRWCGARGMGRDVTEQREQERAQRQKLLRDRLMTYLRDTIHNEINPEKTLPAALSGTGLAIGADGGMIINGHPAAAGYDTIAWGTQVPDAVFLEAHAALLEHGSVDLLRDGLQLIGHVTEDGTAGDDRVNGAVLFWALAEGGGFSDHDRSILSDVAAQIGLGIAQLRNYREILALSNTDGLTGLLNRRAIFADLDRRLMRLATTRGTGALIYLDINNLKTQNDVGGHLSGDRAILACADILRAFTRPTDLIARIGGDEFLLWLEGVTEATAVVRVGQMLEQTGRLVAISAVPDRPIGLSFGIALYDGGRPEPLERLVSRADAAMYRAKARRQSGFAVSGDEVLGDGDAA
ncbi:MAG TPA: sensor domain-containing diguanylate cyclase [Aliidongia sp.]|nr:sensor domain-containing diguanylate cyclase [Aliidongia sp.]